MEIKFYVRYVTEYGDDIQLSYFDAEGNENRLQMNYLNNEFWEGILDTKIANLQDKIKYSYVRRHYTNDIEFLKNSFELHFKKLKADSISVLDEWRNDSSLPKIFNTRPFAELIDSESKTVKHSNKKFTHIFYIQGLPLPTGMHYCITGNGEDLGNWEGDKNLVAVKGEKYYEIRLNLNKAQFPVTYKVGVYDETAKRIVNFESGPDRIIYGLDKAELSVFHILASFPDFSWKASGINFPVSALKTRNSWGCGDFTDLKPVVDLCKKTGIKLIQLLPVNDTTSTHTNKDSYPYSAITAFGLHPAYLNVKQLAKELGVKIDKDVQQKIDELEAAPTLQYEQVLSLKLETARKLYNKEKAFLKDDLNWFEFFDKQKFWLLPYAVFCYLRDKNKTANFNDWPAEEQYSKELVDKLSSANSSAYDEIAFHYFIQYHLFQQLQDAVNYAHKHGVAIKADLPIGVGRNSVDTWVAPHLFNMDWQAGAPPDAFAVKGQNWSFPTYNWEEMAKDGYAWWRQRMEQLSTYADAVRIDHVLGFFRIWSIPLSAREGILGRFIPAWGLKYYDFENAGLYFNDFRLCESYFTEDILWQKFGEHKEWVKETFFYGGRFKEELNTQAKIEAYFNANPYNDWAKQGLFDILSDKILIKDEYGNYHFRINIFETNSFKHFNDHDRHVLDTLYNKYFFSMQDGMWKDEGIKKLNALQQASNNMLLCAEDLGMVPEMVPGVLEELEILTLSVERMPKKSTEKFSLPGQAHYTSVVTPSTHDMSTLREWWEEDRDLTQDYYNHALGNYGEAPQYCEPWVAKQILQKHLESPAMWTVILLQDLLAMNGDLRRENPLDERINVPANPDHFWNYRMHLKVEDITGDSEFCQELKAMNAQSKRV